MTDTAKNFDIIKPGSAEWASALSDVKSLEDAGTYEGGKGTEVKLNVLNLSSSAGRRFQGSHGIQVLGNYSKVFVHFKGVVSADYEELGTMLYFMTAKTLNVPLSQAEAGPSPVFRHQFDYVLLGIPNLRGPEIHRRIVEAVSKAFS